MWLQFAQLVGIKSWLFWKVMLGCFFPKSVDGVAVAWQGPFCLFLLARSFSKKQVYSGFGVCFITNIGPGVILWGLFTQNLGRCWNLGWDGTASIGIGWQSWRWDEEFFGGTLRPWIFTHNRENTTHNKKTPPIHPTNGWGKPNAWLASQPAGQIFEKNVGW